MSIIWAIVIGLLVGIVAKFLMPGRQGGGIIVTALLGIVGAVVATFLGQAMGIYAAGQSAGFIASVIGAIVVSLRNVWLIFKSSVMPMPPWSCTDSWLTCRQASAILIFAAETTRRRSATSAVSTFTQAR